MRSPWIDLLFLHGHATPTQLAWRPDATSTESRRAACTSVQVDVTALPLPPRPNECREPACA